MTKNIRLKTPAEIKTMAKGGSKLAKIKSELAKRVKNGTSAMEIENLATALIKQSGGQPSFKMVPGYHWTTCINVNEGLVHGIPKKETIFKNGDIVSIDVGMYFKGFHTDTSLTVLVGKNPQKEKFLKSGKLALAKAIEKVRAGNIIYDISKAIQDSLKKDGLTPIKALVGHGVGRDLHEAPAVPCYVGDNEVEKVKLVEGMVLAIEVMYAAGGDKVVTFEDGWTIGTKDGKIAGLFEETVAIVANGPLILTDA